MEALNLSKNVGRSCMVSDGRGGHGGFWVQVSRSDPLGEPWRASLLKVSKAAKRLLSQAEAESIDATAAIGSSPYFPAPGSRKLFQLPMSSAVWMSHILSEGVLTVWFSQDSFYDFYAFLENTCIEINAERAQILTSQNHGQDGRCSSSHMYNYLLRKRMGHNGTKRYKGITKRSKGNNRLKLQRSAASATDHNSGPGMMRHFSISQLLFRCCHHDLPVRSPESAKLQKCLSQLF